MSIRLRLILSYVAMIIIPVILFLISMILIVGIFVGDFQSLRNQFNPPNEQERAKYKWDNDIVIEIKTLASYYPQKLHDSQYLKQLDHRLQRSQTGLIIMKSHQTSYMSPLLKNKKLESILQKKIGSKTGQFQTGDRTYSYHQINTKNFRLFLVKDISVFNRVAENFWYIPLSLLLALIISNGFLTYFVSRSIIRPLDTLKQATEEIKKGNLDFAVKPIRDDEIGKLSLAYEEMRQRLKESLELQQRYEENRKELVSNISHDLKTPITAIKGYVEGIRDGVANSPDKLAKYLSIIEQKTNDMDQLIDELFLFSKLDLKRVPFHFEKIALNPYLQNCVEELQYDLHAQSFEITYQPIDPSVYVRIDQEKLKRVISNIAGNSMKYMDKEKGRINISTKFTDEWVTVEIQDNGPGISPDALPHIFDRFYRADDSRNTKTGGSGLGLAIAKQMIEEHGGEIWAESEIDQGTRICFRLQRIRET